MNEAPPQPTTPMTTSAPQVAAQDISAEQQFTLVDVGLVAAVVAVALWYLYRQLWTRRGQCGGCAKGAGSCAVQRGTQPPAAENGCTGGGGREVGVPLDSIRRRPS